MIEKQKITLVTPCRNEEAIIGRFVSKVPEYVDEVLVVDNNSTDRSIGVARKAGARVLRENRQTGGIGYGFAHMRGIAEAKGDFIVAMDADDTYPVDAIKSIVTYMDRYGLDFVSCNRFPLTRKNAISWVRQLGITILNIETLLLYGYPMSDILTGMWVVRKSAARMLKLQEGDWNFSPEIKLAALTNPNIHFDEHHIDHFERENEPSKQQLFRTGFMHMRYIFLRWTTRDNAVVKTTQWLVRLFASHLAYHL